jgi:hypothetical protein
MLADRETRKHSHVIVVSEKEDTMKTQRFAVVLTVVNLLILLFALPRVGQATAQVVPVLRGRSLEIVDGFGKVRAQLSVLPPSTMPDGKKYPETVLLRLIDPNGRPGVKIGGSVEGSGISLAGDSERREWSGVQILAEGAGSSVKLTNKDGRQQLIKP